MERAVAKAAVAPSKRSQPFFARYAVADIDVVLAERYREEKLIERERVKAAHVMRQVGHEESRTTLKVYAQVQQRLSRKQVHQAFDDLLATAGEATDVPTAAREKMPSWRAT